MKKLFELVGVLRIDGLSKVQKEIASIEKTVKQTLAPIEKFGKQIEGVGKNLTTAFTLPLALAGGAVLKFGGDFEAAMTNSLSIMGNVSEEMKAKMEETALNLSETLPQSSKMAAEAYFFLASAGKNAAQSVALLPKVAEFATAGNFAMADATSFLLDAQSALGLSSRNVAEDQMNLVRVSDVLVKANVLANANVQQFSESLTNKAAAALRMVNKDVEEGVAVLAAFAQQGVKGQVAGEQLAIVMRDLQRVSLKNREAFKAAGIEVYDSAGKMNNLGDIIGMLEKRFAGMSDEQKRSEMTMLGFQDRSVGALLTIIGMSDNIHEYESALRKAGGTTKEVADKQMNDFNNQLTVLKNSLVNVVIEFSTSLLPIMKNQVIPFFKELVGHAKEAVIWFNNLPEGVQNFVFGLAALLTVAGPSLIILGKLIGSIKIITTTITAAKLAMVAFNVTIATSPIGLAVAGIAILTTAFLKLGTGTDKFATQFGKIKESAEEQKAEFDVLSQRLIILSENQNKSTQAHKDYEQAIDDMKNKYPGYFAELDKEKTKHTELLSILEKQKQAFYEKLVMQMREKEIQVFVEKQIQLQKELNKIKDLELTQAAEIRIREKELEPLKEQANISIKKEIENRKKLREEVNKGAEGLDEYQQGIRASISDLTLQENIVYDNQEAFKGLDDQKQAHFETEQAMEKLQKEINSLRTKEIGITNEYKNLLGGVAETKQTDNKLTQEQIALLKIFPEAIVQQMIKNAELAKSKTELVGKTLEQIAAEKKLHEEAEKQAEEKNNFIESYQDRIDKLVLTETEQLDLEEKRAMETAEKLKLSEEEKEEIRSYYATERFNLQIEEDAAYLDQLQATSDEEMRIILEENAKIEAEDAKMVEAKRKKWDTIKNFIVAALSMATDVYSLYTNYQIAKIDEKLAKEKDAVEQSKLTEEDKQKKFDELDAKAAKKKKELNVKQAKADKAQSMTNASISTWEAATKALTAGPFLGPVMAGIITALGLAKVALIAAAPLPQLKEGAMIKKSQGGTAVVVGEGGEDETVLPMEKGAAAIAEGIFNRLSEAFLPGSHQYSFASAGGGMGTNGPDDSSSRQVHLHIGTLIADKQGLKQLERTLLQYRVSEETRKGE